MHHERQRLRGRGCVCVCACVHVVQATAPYVVTLSRPEAPTHEEVIASQNVVVDEHLNRINTAQAISQAVSLSTAGEYRSACSLLEQAMQRLQVSYSASECPRQPLSPRPAPRPTRHPSSLHSSVCYLNPFAHQPPPTLTHTHPCLPLTLLQPTHRWATTRAPLPCLPYCPIWLSKPAVLQ
jgi:hypothetical protein